MNNRLSNAPGFTQDEEIKAFQGLMLDPIAYLQANGRTREITERKKLYWWWRLQGCSKAKAARQAGYSASVVRGWSSARREKAGERTAISKHFHLEQITPGYIKGRILEIAQNAPQPRDRLSAWGLLAQMQGMFTKTQVQNSPKAMTAVFNLPMPACPKCGYVQGETTTLPRGA